LQLKKTHIDIFSDSIILWNMGRIPQEIEIKTAELYEKSSFGVFTKLIFYVIILCTAKS